jgi:hypothetical protein
MNNTLNTPALPQRHPILFRIAVAGWILFALLCVALHLLDVVTDFHQVQVPCEGNLGFVAGCNFLAISADEVAVLNSWGLTLRTYAIFLLAAPLLNLLVYCTLGGLILWRQGRSWLGLTVSLTLVTMPFAIYAASNDWSAIHPALFWPGVIASLLSSAMLIIFLNLMPNGRFAPRWAYLPMTLGLLLLVILTLHINGVFTLAEQSLSFIYTALISGLVLSGGFQIYRYKRVSNTVERQQTKWIIFAVAAYFASILAWVIVFGGGVPIPSGSPRLLANLAGTLFIDYFALPVLPIAITIAILRYNLWGIDLIIRRTLQYAVLTGLLALTYYGGIVILQEILGPITGSKNSPVVTVITTLSIAALFNPLRIRVQDFIDRRFYRKKYNAEQALAQFAAIARDEVDMEKLTTALLGMVEETMQSEKVTLWLKASKKKGYYE